MSLSEIISDAVSYPFTDIQKFLIVGVISIIAGLSDLFKGWGFDSLAILAVAGIIGIIFSVILSGYGVSVIRNAINNSREIPDFDFMTNLIDGIKAIIIGIVYFIIPVIITVVLAIVTGAIGAGLDHIMAGLGVFVILAIIVFIIFGIFAVVALARFADTGELGAALSIGNVIEDAKRIGFGKIILVLIAVFIVAIVISVVLSILAIIPFIGILLVYLIAGGFAVLFYNRAIGLLYID